MTRPRVLVVDDSAFARTVLSRVLRANGQIDVIGTARDGDDALERITALDPDVITLDLTMPGRDGLGVLRALNGRPRPRAIVVSISSIDSEIGAEALTLGAVELIAKPTALANDRLQEIGDQLIATVLAVAAGLPVPIAAPIIAPRRAGASAAALVMIGTSTGGPQALTRLISALPATLTAPVAIVLHIPAGYTASLAQRLDRISALEVVEAEDGLKLRPGQAVLARGGMHLRIVRAAGHLVAQLGVPTGRQFTPSVDELFESGVAAVGAGALGVVLTGMGDDGLVGARKIAAAGGALLTEASSTCVVYGMPRCVYEAGLGAVDVPLDSMAEAISQRA
ncbi:MAG: chemotaxis-specific protein-glutamate methyltransferase CheB [Myxococcales bacterium]|nr:chemotaxis-specific protein-glutamate methyltransferase CheB [Myxococcales bacterium]